MPPLPVRFSIFILFFESFIFIIITIIDLVFLKSKFRPHEVKHQKIFVMVTIGFVCPSGHHFFGLPLQTGRDVLFGEFHFKKPILNNHESFPNSKELLVCKCCISIMNVNVLITWLSSH